jgi:hypothetical protein
LKNRILVSLGRPPFITVAKRTASGNFSPRLEEQKLGVLAQIYHFFLIYHRERGGMAWQNDYH